jgi:hypothetical protein
VFIIIRWDPSTTTTEYLHEYMKGVYMPFYNCVNELVLQAEKIEGRDTLNYERKVV